MEALTLALAQFHFIRPEWFWALLPTLLIVLFCWRQFRSSASWQQIIAPELLQHLLDQKQTGVRRNPALLLLATWLIALLALAGPTWQKQTLPVHQKLDALVIVLDLSLSMYAEDVKPSRLVRARHKLLDILKSRKEGVTALIAYAGDTHIVSPLTDDNATIANLVPALAPAIMPLPGSEPGTAIAEALALFQSATIDRGRILLITDSITDADIKTISQQLAGSPFELSLLGIGTEDGAPIPLHKGELLKDNQGNIIVPKYKRSQLQALANKTGGRFTDIRWDESDTQYLLAGSLNEELAETLDTGRQAEQWQDSGYWLVLLLLPVVLLSFRRGWLLSLALPLLLLPTEQAYAFEWQDLWQTRDQQATKALETGDSTKAAELFENPRWSAAANYQAGQYEQAAKVLENASTADDFYNQGNALTKAGKFDEAIEAYQKALELEADMEDASFNKKLVEDLKQQQENQQQESQQQNQSDDQQQDQSGEQQQDQNQQGQNQQQDSSGQEQSPGEQQNSENQSQQGEEQNEHPEQSKPEQTDEEQAEQQSQASQDEQAEGEQEQQTASAEAGTEADTETKEELEQEQATEQWLRRVPDDPSGLLRRKFDYESKKQRKENNGNNNTYW